MTSDWGSFLKLKFHRCQPSIGIDAGERRLPGRSEKFSDAPGFGR
jgi:hypothetical protein